MRSPEGPAPSDPEAATTREFVGPSRWADAKDWTWLQVGRGRWVTARAEADRRIIVVELRGRAAVGDQPDKFERLTKLEKNWDSYGGDPISPAAIERAKNWLAGVCVVPLSGGGVQLEWHSEGVDVEIEFKGDGTTEAFAEEVARRVPRDTPTGGDT